MNLLDMDAAGDRMHALAADLFPICRSITGQGVRTSLARLAQEISLKVLEIPSGASVYDWTVPEEWNVRQAWIKDSQGREILNFKNHNLHLVGYSTPIHETLSLAALDSHLFSLPNQPDLIPYRTSYYKKTWGFCLTHTQRMSLLEDDYEVYIDSAFSQGSLTYGEFFIPGETEDEVLISCHTCHPSLANDNLSGMVVGVELAKYLARHPQRLSYRFLFAPATVGSIAWLATNHASFSKVKHGLVLTCVGDAAPITYKKSRLGDLPIDRAMQHVLGTSGSEFSVVDFHPYGYDERQFCSPGINLPVGCLMRSVHGTFPEYHTSADNLDFIRPAHLADSLNKTIEAFDVLEKNATFNNLKPMCEPRLGKYGLYGGGGGQRVGDFDELALLWVLNQSDGSNDLLSIAERSGMKFSKIQGAADALEKAGLLQRILESNS